MTRTEYLQEMVKRANGLIEDYTVEKDNELWEMSSSWNSNHSSDEEIAMCELWEDENGNETDEMTGFTIEDDRWFYKD